MLRLSDLPKRRGRQNNVAVKGPSSTSAMSIDLSMNTEFCTVVMNVLLPMGRRLRPDRSERRTSPTR